MSPPPGSKGSREGLSERTQMVPIPKRSTGTSAKAAAQSSKKPAAPASATATATERGWKKFRWTNLEKVSRLQSQLVRRLDWLLPQVTRTAEVSDSVNSRLAELLEEQVHLTVEYIHVVPTRGLRRYVGDPTFLAVLAPQPNKTRGFLEVELGLAHAAIDLLLGGAGEALALRSLTDIEEGVMTYVILEMLKVLTPHVDPQLPKLRLEGVCRNFEEAVQVIGDEQHLAVVQLKATFGGHTGYIRIFVPQSVLSLANPTPDAEVRMARRRADAEAHVSRLSFVKTSLRAEIGSVQITSDQLVEIREKDVVLVDELTAHPQKGEGGTAKLKVGAGYSGWLDAEVFVEGRRLKAKVTGFTPGEVVDDPEELDQLEVQSAGSPDDSTHPGTELPGRNKVDEMEKGADGSELLNDIPLRVAVELGRVPMTAEEVVGIKIGQIIDLHRVVGEPIDLSVNGKVVARGELVEIDGNLGVRVLSMTG